MVELALAAAMIALAVLLLDALALRRCLQVIKISGGAKWSDAIGTAEPRESAYVDLGVGEERRVAVTAGDDPYRGTPRTRVMLVGDASRARGILCGAVLRDVALVAVACALAQIANLGGRVG